MTSSAASEAHPASPPDPVSTKSPLGLRVWPGVVLAVALAITRFGVSWTWPGFEGFRVAFLGGFALVLAILVWWLFFSRAPKSERWIGLLAMVATWVGVLWVRHPSMGLMWFLGYAVPIQTLALVAWAVVHRHPGGRVRRGSLLLTLALACGFWTLVRSDGMTGDHVLEFHWRWTPTGEERLLAADGPAEPVARGLEEASETASGTLHWPGFRGATRDGVVRGTTLATDWSQAPPVELWRRAVGPGWSSLAVHGDLVVTQEQRGDDEAVTAYDARTGELVWRHTDPVRFFESMAGAGPRSTPTVHEGWVVALGATGRLNALEAASGTQRWSRDVAADTGAKVPIWGLASSPLVLDDRVVVAAGGRLVAYDRSTGSLVWLGPEAGESYSSPQRMTLDGADQIVLLAAEGATGFSPDEGTALWHNPWKGLPLVQPAITSDGDLLTSAGEGFGVRRLQVRRDGADWRVEERWTSNRLKPNFNDFVIQRGHAYGFDGNLLACLDLATGERVWKGGRYGQGQLLLVADQELLLVISERGELVLVEATPERFHELARFPALEGKTWNHPVLVEDLLLVRNSQEMAAFRLPRSGG